MGLLTPSFYSFQIISTELSDQLAQIGDSVFAKGGAVDSNRTEVGGDSSMTARWVWNTPQLNHTGSGTFGSYLDAKISSLGIGSGTFAVTLVAFDSVANVPIARAAMSIRTIDQLSLVALTSASANPRQSHARRQLREQGSIFLSPPLNVFSITGILRETVSDLFLSIRARFRQIGVPRKLKPLKQAPVTYPLRFFTIPMKM